MLANETILVTGATSGFGKEIAIDCVKNGAKVIAIGRRVDLLNKLKSSLPKEKIAVIKFDILQDDPEVLLEQTIPDDFKDITALVNNAGLALGFNKFHLGNLSDFKTVINTNITGLVAITHSVLKKIMIPKNSGYVINIGSIAGNHPTQFSNVYGATKSFVKMFSYNLRADLHGTKIRVTNVEPGLAETEFSIVRFSGDTEKASNVYKNMNPLTAKDISKTVIWLLETPKHMNVNSIEVMPTSQSHNGWAVHRGE